MDDNNDIELLYDCWQEGSCSISSVSKSLTEQNVAINNHNDAMILYTAAFQNFYR